MTPVASASVAFETVRQAGHVHGLACRDQAELDVPVGPAQLLAVEDMAGVEVGDLAGNLGGEPGRVEGLDAADPGAPGDEVLPGRLDPGPERGDEPQAGDDDPRRNGGPGRGEPAHRTSFPVRTVAAR